MVRIYNNDERQEVFNNVQKENGREKFSRLGWAVKTCQNLAIDKTVRANANQRDLAIAMRRIVSPGGVDERLGGVEEEDIDASLPNDTDWELWQQYESVMAPMRELSTFTQHAKVIVHCELFEVRRTLERLRAPFFEAFENVSEKVGSLPEKDLTVSSTLASIC